MPADPLPVLPPARSAPTAGRDRPLGRSPFAGTIPSILAAGAWAVAAGAWVVAGAGLPGGRWAAVHLFTLGVLSNLVLGFSDHFARTLTRTPGDLPRWQTPVANAGALLVVAGLPTGTTWALAAGATVLTGVVVASYLRMRRMRRAAVGARFAWVVRSYERAHGAFAHAAILGALLGTGVLGGTWYLSARTAHLHAAILGWGGLTLLATLVLFGPTMARTRIRPGADDRAARVLRHGATGLSAATVLLLATGLGGTAGTVARIAAAVGLAAFAVAATVTCLSVADAARRAAPSAARWPVLATAAWLPLVVWADVALVAAGAWQHLDRVGAAVLLGVLLQAVLATLTYLAPMLRGRTTAAREVVRHRLARLSSTRAVGYNAAVAAVLVASAVGGRAGAVLARTGWLVVIAAVAHLAVVAALPARPRSGQPAA